MKILTAIVAGSLLCTACDVKVDEGGIRGVGVAEGRAEDVWTRTYTLASGGRLEIIGQHGNIEVSGSSAPQVEVRAEREVRANTEEEARAALARLQILEQVAPDRVKLSAAGEETERGLPGFAGRLRTRVRYVVRVPHGLTLTLRTENGSVQLENVNGRTTAATTNGSVTGTGVAGSLDGETVNGGIRIAVASLTADVRLATTNGTVRLDLPAEAKATLDLSCVNGSMSIDDRFGIGSAERGAKAFTGALNGGGPTVSVSSVNGSIRIRASRGDGGQVTGDR